MLDKRDDAAVPGEGRHTNVGTESLYTRSMPGGGNVRVELVVSDRGNVGSERRLGRVVMEPRGTGAVVVEELEGDDENVMVAELFRIAHDNAAIARRMLRRRAD